MIRQSVTALQNDAPALERLCAAATRSEPEYGTLLLDDLARIRSCDESTEKLFHASQAQLAGRWISAYFEIFRQPSYSARYLVQQRADGQGQELVLTDADGVESAVEVTITRRMSDGREVFLLTLRRCGEAAH